jgi:hypothetical protein
LPVLRPAADVEVELSRILTLNGNSQYSRPAGDGEIYAYMPLDDANDKNLLRVPPLSKRNPDYGFSVGRGAFQFTPGKWVTVAQRVRLNDPARADGE